MVVNFGVTQNASIDACIIVNLYIIVNDYFAQVLQQLVFSGIVFLIAKTIIADSIVAANNTVVPNYGIGKNCSIVKDHGVLSNCTILINDHVMSDVAI